MSSDDRDEVLASSPCVGLMAFHPTRTRAVTDPAVLDEGRVFAEAIAQTEPLARGGSREAAQTARFLRQTTARPSGLAECTSREQVVTRRSLQALVGGANGAGKAKEVVVASDYADLHRGKAVAIVNPPDHVAPNVERVRLSPDTACKRDILLQVRTGDGTLLTVPGGQVKTGSGRYVANSLVEMTTKPGYGRTGYVDARFVNPDGSPRIALDGFTKTEAGRLADAGVKLRGIPDLDARGEALLRNISLHADDGLDPVARAQFEQLRHDIAQAYSARGTVQRAVSGAALAAASAVLAALVVQGATEGEFDLGSVGKAARDASLIAGTGAIAETALYYGGRAGGLIEQGAREFAVASVGAGFCALAIGADVHAEVRRVLDGEASVAEATAAGAVKSALDLFPMIVAPLGLAGVPILLVTQGGGRWLVTKASEAEGDLDAARADDRRFVGDMRRRFEALTGQTDSTDMLYARLFPQRKSVTSTGCS